MHGGYSAILEPEIGLKNQGVLMGRAAQEQHCARNRKQPDGLRNHV